MLNKLVDDSDPDVRHPCAVAAWLLLTPEA